MLFRSQAGAQDPSPPPSLSNSRLKAAPPSEFDGDRKFGRRFLNQCRLYMHLSPSLFPSDSLRINWILSYMKSGRASTFSERVQRWEIAHPGKSRFKSYLDFEEVFITEFCEQFDDVHARVCLETSKYYQGSRSVDEYVDNFLDLIERAGYEDSIDGSNVMRFRRGLNTEIQDSIAHMGELRPHDADLDAWIRHARLLAQNREANIAFKSTSHSRLPSPKNSQLSKPQLHRVDNFPKIPAPTFQPPVTSRLPSGGVPVPFVGVPMDVDAARQRGKPPKPCFRCQGDHWSNQCPLKFDIRALTMQDLLQLASGMAQGQTIEEVLAVTDADSSEAESSPVDNCRLSDNCRPTSVETPTPVPAEVADFHKGRE